MPHPIMFGDDDMGLAEVRGIALSFPGASEKISHGRPVFCAPKMFAIYGGSAKGSAEGGGSTRAGGEHIRYPHAVLVKVDQSDRQALAQDRRIFYPAYMGPYGWLGLDFTAARVDWDEVAELIDASFRLVASTKLIAQLDGS